MSTGQDQPAGKRTLSVLEAASLLGIGRTLAYKLAQEGKLPGARRLGRRVVVSRDEFDLYLNSQRAGGG